jgi:sarcosine oxidase subunit beta
MALSATDVLVIGGGLMGCSTAYHLAREGARVTMIERNAQPGMETTARSGAIIRAHYGVPQLVTLALAANKRYRNFAEDIGMPCGFVPSGYSVLVDDADAQTLRDIVAMHQSLGVNAVLLPPSELKSLVPAVRTDDAALAAYEPEGGYASPQMTISAYSAQSKDLGADLRFDCAVTKAEKQGSGWCVTFGDGDMISAGQVVLCTGNWSKPVGALFGMELPVTPVRAQIVVLERPASFAGVFPVVSDLINLAYFRADGEGGMWVGSSDSADLQESLPHPDGYDEGAGTQAVADARRKASLRFAGMDAPGKDGVQRAFSGLYETTPDWQPIMDSFGDGLHAAVGFSGHGFKLAPVVGEAMAARAQGRPDPFDISLFALSRFAEERPIRSSYPYQRAKFLR